MKKMMAAFIALTLSLSLAACGNSAQSSASAELTGQQSASAQIAENAPPETPSASQSNIPPEASAQEASPSQSTVDTLTDTSISQLVGRYADGNLHVP